MSRPLLLALDAGTTGIRALLFDRLGRERGAAYEELGIACPHPGWVETDAGDLWTAARRVIAAAMRAAGAAASDVAAIGVANQRGTTIVWERSTGRALRPAVVWQDVRTATRVEQLQAAGLFASVMTSASKLEWLLADIEGGRERAAAGELCFGTVDSWLLWNLTGGRVHATDHSNASCTGLYDFGRGGWDRRALQTFGVPSEVLPSILPSCGTFGDSDGDACGLEAPVAAVSGDQQASMFGQLRDQPGDFKVTFGTSAMVDVNTGATPVLSRSGAYPLVLWGLGDRRLFCLEGSAITAGAAVQWLRDGLGLIRDAAETAALARQVPDSGGVWIVPAFQGLGTPHMQPDARALIGGLSRASTRGHIARAMLEGISFRCGEIVATLAADLDRELPPVLRADGGAAENEFLMQHLADVLGVVVERPATVQATALGAALLAGVGVGIWEGVAEIRQFWRPGATFEPRWRDSRRAEEVARWQERVGACRSLPDPRNP